MMHKHPFDRMFLAAARRASNDEAAVANVARELISKGYPKDEVLEVLIRLRKTCIDPVLESYLSDAIEQID
jgi:hypothetical protein